MLILDRRVGQKIIIGTDVVVTVKDISRKGSDMTVRIAIEAPNHICIDRLEVRKRRKESVDRLLTNEED